MRSFARKNLHRTGALNDSGKVEARLDQILTALRDETSLETVGSILEIGPGQTSYLIFQLNEHLNPNRVTYRISSTISRTRIGLSGVSSHFMVI